MNNSNLDKLIDKFFAEKSFRPTVVCLVLDKVRKSFLLIESPKNPGIYFPPQGGMEHLETVEEASLRELEEETGIKARFVSKCGYFTQSYKQGREPRDGFESGKCYIITLLESENPSINLNLEEIQSYKWVKEYDLENSLKAFDKGRNIIEVYRIYLKKLEKRLKKKNNQLFI
jgi:8-oxo-dGTP pyrophosphatase MutT (NUDIX family)